MMNFTFREQMHKQTSWFTDCSTATYRNDFIQERCACLATTMLLLIHTCHPFLCCYFVHTKGTHTCTPHIRAHTKHTHRTKCFPKVHKPFLFVRIFTMTCSILSMDGIFHLTCEVTTSCEMFPPSVYPLMGYFQNRLRDAAT